MRLSTQEVQSFCCSYKTFHMDLLRTSSFAVLNQEVMQWYGHFDILQVSNFTRLGLLLISALTNGVCSLCSNFYTSLAFFLRPLIVSSGSWRRMRKMLKIKKTTYIVTPFWNSYCLIALYAILNRHMTIVTATLSFVLLRLFRIFDCVSLYFPIQN